MRCPKRTHKNHKDYVISIEVDKFFYPASLHTESQCSKFYQNANVMTLSCINLHKIATLAPKSEHKLENFLMP